MIGIQGHFLYHVKDAHNSDDLVKHHGYFHLKGGSHGCHIEIIDIIGQHQIIASALQEMLKACYVFGVS